MRWWWWLVLCWPAVAHADWGVALVDSYGATVVARWYAEGAVLVGSGADADLQHPSLSVSHALISNDQGQLAILPLAGKVLLDGEVITQRTTFGHEQTVSLPPFTLRFLGFDTESEDDSENEAEYDDTENEAEDPDAPPDSDAQRDALVGDIGRSVEHGRPPEFQKQAYAFCHDPEFGKRSGVVGVDFCAIFDETSDDVCPEARKHCAQWRTSRGGMMFGRGGGGKGGARRVSKPSQPIVLPAIPPVIAWIVVGVGLVLVLIWFVRIWQQGKKDLLAELAQTSVLDEAARNLQALPETRAQALLVLAAQAMAAGNFSEAAILMHLAVLRFLDDENLARYHPSKTNGDYLRAIRSHRPLAQLFRDVARQTERLRFGDGRVDEAALPQLCVQAQQLLKRRDPGIATSSVAVLLALSLSACGNQGGERRAYYSYGPAGLSAWPDLLESAGMQVTIHTGQWSKIDPETTVAVIRTSAAGRAGWPDRFSIDPLLDKQIDVVLLDDLGVSSLFFPVVPGPTSSSSTAVTLALAAGESNPCKRRFDDWDIVLGQAPVKLPPGRVLRATGMASSSTISAHAWSLSSFLVANPVDRGFHALAGQRYDAGGVPLPGCFYLFSDRDLFTNASLSRGPNAALVGRFFGRLVAESLRGAPSEEWSPEDGSVVFLDSFDRWSVTQEGDELNGGDGDSETEAPNHTEVMAASNLLPFLAQSFFGLALFLWAVGAAFGPLRDRKRSEHKAFVNHVEAMGRLYARTGQPGLTHAAQSLARLLVLRLRNQLRGGTRQGWSALAAELAAKHQVPEAHVRAVLRLGIEQKNELGAPGPQDPAPSSPEVLGALTRLLGVKSSGPSAPKKGGRLGAGPGE